MNHDRMHPAPRAAGALVGRWQHKIREAILVGLGIRFTTVLFCDGISLRVSMELRRHANDKM